jgi:hypothetical protein
LSFNLYLSIGHLPGNGIKQSACQDFKNKINHLFQQVGCASGDRWAKSAFQLEKPLFK